MGIKANSGEMRKAILRKAFKKAENPEDPFSKDELLSLHRKLAEQAKVLTVPPEHRQILNIVSAIESSSGSPQNFRQRESQGLAVNALFGLERPLLLN